MDKTKRTIFIEITESQAEEVLVALNHRTKQVRIAGEQQAAEIAEIGAHIAERCEAVWDWHPGVWARMQAMQLSVHVRVK